MATLATVCTPPEPLASGDIPPLTLGHPGGRENEPATLKISGLVKHFGGVKAVDDVDMAVERNTVHALIGPNGSGKTSLLNVLSGIYRPTAGHIEFDGENITT